MNTLVLATEEQEAEVSLKFYNRAYLHLQDPAELKAWLPQADLVIDLLLHERPKRLAQYNQQGKGDKITVFFNANHLNLTEFTSAYAPLNFNLAGLIGEPLVNKEVLEVVPLREDSHRSIDKAFVFLASLYQLVKV
ncbi:hypothetical protein [Rufibacter hautae]|uniref:Uncharacterized protein n=1 Tax=Rufibacter hautae TaxID=2595005 RepID=A0A5B6TK57_9BACT|nr:hypothetical protein [Rufibacter hautae]KAA3440366.1 hypothetical protein FOA19_06850 [Rufibacter hautae]